MNEYEIILKLLQMAGVGVVSSFFTYFLTSRGFRHRKWWELKVTAYTDTIKSLSDLLHYYNQYFNAEANYRELPRNISEDLKNIWVDSCKIIKRSAYSGSFLFSKRAEIALISFLKVIDSDSHQYKTAIDYYDCGYDAAKKCINELEECSKIDLRLKESIIDKC